MKLRLQAKAKPNSSPPERAPSRARESSEPTPWVNLSAVAVIAGLGLFQSVASLKSKRVEDAKEGRPAVAASFPFPGTNPARDRLRAEIAGIRGRLAVDPAEIRAQTKAALDEATKSATEAQAAVDRAVVENRDPSWQESLLAVAREREAMRVALEREYGSLTFEPLRGPSGKQTNSAYAFNWHPDLPPPSHYGDGRSANGRAPANMCGNGHPARYDVACSANYPCPVCGGCCCLCEARRRGFI